MTASRKNIPGYKGLKARKDYIYLAFKYDGKTRIEPTGLPVNKANLKQALEKVNYIVSLITRGQFVYIDQFPHSLYARKKYGDVKISTYSTVVTQWWASWKRDNYSKPASTLYQYQCVIDQHIIPAFGDRDISSIAPQEIADWLGNIRSTKAPFELIGDKRADGIAVHMRRVFQYAIGKQLIETDPFTIFEALKKSTKSRGGKAPVETMEPFTQLEMSQIISAIGDIQASERNMIRFNVSMGLRISEVLALTWDDIDLKAGTVTVRKQIHKGRFVLPKYRSIRTLPLSSQAIQALYEQQEIVMRSLPFDLIIDIETKKSGETITEHMGSQRIVFYNSHKTVPYNNSANFNARWNTFLDAAKVKRNSKSGRGRGPNHLRHTFATEALLAGAPIESISSALGHRDIAVTIKHYAKYIPDRMKVGESIFDKYVGWKL